jgi:hypothetical protein
MHISYTPVCSLPLSPPHTGCAPEQKHIYYLVAPSREAALQSPYYETFKKHKKEVLFLYNTIDDFVMSNVKEFGGERRSCRFVMCCVCVWACFLWVLRRLAQLNESRRSTAVVHLILRDF